MKNIKIAVGATVILLAVAFNFTIISKASTFTANLFGSSNEIKSVTTPEIEIGEPKTNIDEPEIILREVTSDNAIKVALLLDTSGSMNGLIAQAKSQLWKIVGELSRMKKGDETPVLQIALYEYGNSNLSITNGYIRQISGFTSDMDLISEKLFALHTAGGDEYCGHVIQTSINQLDWGANQGDLKVIYIAGNESFAQGNIPFSQAASNAVAKGVIVNTIFCGGTEQGIQEHWQAGAIAGKGQYMNISQDEATVYIKTPYDQKINDLNLKLNDTYISYGALGQLSMSNQITQDANAMQFSTANATDRAIFKSSDSYSNATWDAVDAYKKNKNILKEKKKELPDELQKLSDEKVEAKIIEATKKRESIQLQIRQLDKERRAFIEAEKAKNADANNGGGLEESMLKSLRKTAKEKGFEVE